MAAQPEVVHLADMHPRPPFFRRWEFTRHARIHWVVESLAEMGGTFCYTWFGLGSTAGYVFGNILKVNGLGSLFQIGFAYGIGIVLALTINAATSGGHFNPCVTIALCIFRGFPWAKAPRYIFFQILGSYLAALLVYVQWKNFFDLATEAVEGAAVAAATAAGASPAAGAAAATAAFDALNFTPNGPAGILALYINPGSKLGFIFVNELVACILLGLTIWACMDPTNAFVPPAAVPWIIGMAYAGAIWGFGTAGLALNAARDVGGRLAAITIYGTKANGGTYAAIAALTNIPGMIIAVLIYEFVYFDSSRILPTPQREFLRGHIMHAQHRQAQIDGRGHTSNEGSIGSTGVKGRTEMHENA